MWSATNPISHHTSHTMGNGASSSNSGARAHWGGDTSNINDSGSDQRQSGVVELEPSLTNPNPNSSDNQLNFRIIDTTLREVEQSATAHFDTAQKIEIARALDDFGVEYIELTTAAASAQSRVDCEEICKLGLKAKILCHIRCNMDVARLAVEAGVDGINMCIGTSTHLMAHSHGKDMAYIATKAREVTANVKSNNIEVRFSGEDSFCSDFTETEAIHPRRQARREPRLHSRYRGRRDSHGSLREGGRPA
ncbi:HMGL-like-domain-containing protein [Aspergillus undulatus]|uniref:HMGL-like-domain-containing protein n=1 Tax=Aspergillus undulatus TaxID=1810928 RepID=UPI003CCE122C